MENYFHRMGKYIKNIHTHSKPLEHEPREAFFPLSRIHLLQPASFFFS